MEKNHYAIRGGVAGRERLRMLARVMQPFTHGLLDRVGVGPGMSCLDAGCGGGDVTFELARRTGPAGRIVGIDLDDVKLRLAREEAATLGLDNVAFHPMKIEDGDFEPQFDVIYARFLLTHLPDPVAAIGRQHFACGADMGEEADRVVISLRRDEALDFAYQLTSDRCSVLPRRSRLTDGHGKCQTLP